MALLIMRTTQMPIDAAASADLRGVNDNGIAAEEVIKPALPPRGKSWVLAALQEPVGCTSRGVKSGFALAKAGSLAREVVCKPIECGAAQRPDGRSSCRRGSDPASPVLLLPCVRR